MVEDACGAATEEYHRFAVLNFQRLFGRAASTAEVIEEIERLAARRRANAAEAARAEAP